MNPWFVTAMFILKSRAAVPSIPAYFNGFLSNRQGLLKPGKVPRYKFDHESPHEPVQIVDNENIAVVAPCSSLRRLNRRFLQN